MKGSFKKFWKSPWPGVLVLVTAVAFIFIGIFRDEITTVFNKATNICLECIGIG